MHLKKGTFVRSSVLGVYAARTQAEVEKRARKQFAGIFDLSKSCTEKSRVVAERAVLSNSAIS